MRKKYGKKQSLFILCLMLAVTVALSAAGCSGKNEKESVTVIEQQAEPQAEKQSDSQYADSQTGNNVRGEGKTQFYFTVVDQEGLETQFIVHTGKKTVGEALQELELIEGEEGQYGLFVKTVNGITLDYDKDGAYWAFYVNDEYAQAGVGATEITEGAHYAFRVE